MNVSAHGSVPLFEPAAPQESFAVSLWKRTLKHMGVDVRVNGQASDIARHTLQSRNQRVRERSWLIRHIPAFLRGALLSDAVSCVRADGDTSPQLQSLIPSSLAQQPGSEATTSRAKEEERDLQNPCTALALMQRALLLSSCIVGSCSWLAV